MLLQRFQSIEAQNAPFGIGTLFSRHAIVTGHDSREVICSCIVSSADDNVVAQSSCGVTVLLMYIENNL